MLIIDGKGIIPTTEIFVGKLGTIKLIFGILGTIKLIFGILGTINLIFGNVMLGMLMSILGILKAKLNGERSIQGPGICGMAKPVGGANVGTIN